MKPNILILTGFSIMLVLGAYAAKKKLVHVIDQSICTQCGKCVKGCPVEAIKVIKKNGKTIHEIDPALCTQCGICIDNCPEEAIGAVEVKPDAGKDKTEEKGSEKK
ncbi:MAG TPA: 4Fe-4S binding protein [Chitinispirillaceae bacterium]|nr:4Fe-4S binding protein [Chitinispirillaceae bacterium]